MMKQRALKTAAVCMAVVLVGGITFDAGLAAYAEETAGDNSEAVEQELTDAVLNRSGDKDAEKDETVYVIADAGGSVQQVIVSDWLKNGEAKDVLEDASNLSDIENVKGSETYSVNGDSILWEAGGADIYYQGVTDKQLPVDVSVSYLLDGTEITPEELAGKSGRVTIRFDYTNHEKKTVEIEGEDTDIYVPFMMVSGMILDSEKFTDIEVTNGKVISEGNHSIVLGVAMPGLAESLALPEQLDIEIPEYVEVTANVTDFSLDMTITAAMTDMLSDVETDNDGLDSLDDLEELEDSLDQLTEASGQLADGAAEVADGAKELDDGAGEISNGVGQLAEGTDTLQKSFEGEEGAVKGASAVASGAEQVSDGAKTLKSSVSSLNSGAKSVSDGADTLSEGAASLEEGTASLKEGVSAVLTGATSLNTGLGQLSTGAQELAEGAETLDAGVDALVEAVSSLSEELESSYASAMTAFDTAEKNYKDAPDDKDAYANYVAAKAAKETLKQIKAQLDLQFSDKLSALAKGSEELKNGIATASTSIDKLYEGSKTLKSGIQTVSQGTNTLASGASELAGGAEELAEGASTLSQGTEALKKGTTELSSGAKSVSTGASALSKGIKKIYSGVKTVNSNMGSLKLGVKELMGGTGKLYLGTLDLKEGMAEFDEEGVKTLADKLTGILDDYDITALSRRVQETVDAGKEYTIFTAAAEETASSVRFIYRTEGIGE